jgi:hypothetical protein
MPGGRGIAVLVSLEVTAAALAVAASPGSAATRTPGQLFPQVDQPGVTDTEIRAAGAVSKTNPLGATTNPPSTV